MPALPPRPVNTYSIVAHDPATGQIGVAVQSHYFSVGAVVPWGEAGVGVVATQSRANVDFGPYGLARLREGASPNEALDALLAADPGRELRQVAILDARGRVAVHTGSGCIPDAGHHLGDGYAVQANLMHNPRVWPAMAAAYESAEGDLADRLLAALTAAQDAGGDIRGQQSAALLVVSGERSATPWHGRVFDLRVEDHPAPVEELYRLVRLRRAYRLLDAGRDALVAGDVEAGGLTVLQALNLAPETPEIQFYGALVLVGAGMEEPGLARFKDLFAAAPHWAEVLNRMVVAGFIPEDPALLARVMAQRPGVEGSS